MYRIGFLPLFYFIYSSTENLIKIPPSNENKIFFLHRKKAAVDGERLHSGGL